jgi:tRNA threonylcarbamoyladenosine biosynthesis protein TsaE
MILQNITLDKMSDLAKSFLESVESEQYEAAYVVHLVGSIGAGKTTFTKSLAKELGVIETLHSPTFVMMREYECRENHINKKFRKLLHIDAYRFENKSEGDFLGLATELKDKNTMIVIEWPELMHAPKFDAELSFSYTKNKDGVVKEDYRDIKISYAK